MDQNPKGTRRPEINTNLSLDKPNRYAYVYVLYGTVYVAERNPKKSLTVCTVMQQIKYLTPASHIIPGNTYLRIIGVTGTVPQIRIFVEIKIKKYTQRSRTLKGGREKRVRTRVFLY
jgi:hypothetical protein